MGVSAVGGGRVLFVLLLSTDFLLKTYSAGKRRRGVGARGRTRSRFMTALATTSSDTILALYARYVSLLGTGRASGTLSVLCSVSSTNVTGPLAVRRQRTLAGHFRHFPMVHCQLSCLDFSARKGGSIGCGVRFAPHSSSSAPNDDVKFVFGPVGTGKR